MRSLFLLVLLLGLAAGEPPLGLVATRLSTGLSAPVGIVHAPGDASRLFVIEQRTGAIRIIDLPAGTVRATPFLTVAGIAASGSEEGLLGLAFHPQYAANGHIYVNVTAPRPGGGGNRTEIRRYTRSAGNPQTADPATMQLVLAYDQPQSNHNGGWLGFGLDGLLYIAAGDGGASNDSGTGHSAGGNAQDRGNLLGKLLRLDVDGGSPYAIPAGNPYVGQSGRRGELWAIGLRNPWRCDVDPATGDIWIGDVGQGEREEISLAPAGQAGMNFGWRPWEGNFRKFAAETPVSTHTPPIVDYDRTFGYCVIGGCIYRGAAMPGLAGTYFYADYGSARFFSLRYSASGGVTQSAERTAELKNGQTFDTPTSFGRDAAGEIYFTDYNSGHIWRIGSSLAVSGAATLAPTTVGIATSRSLTASGGRTPYVWSLGAGSLPAGMALDAASGAVTGSPSAAGTASFTLRVTDQNGARIDRACTLLVNPAPAVATASLPGGTVGQAYSQTLAATGGTAPLAWTVSAGALPSGLALSSGGTISGTPAGAGTATFTVRVADAVGASATRVLSIAVGAGVVITSSPTIAPATVGAPAARTLTASGGATPYAFTVTAGSLPAGTALASSGSLSGTPTAAGTASFTVQVAEAGGATASQACTWLVNPAPAVTTASLPGGTIGVAYSRTLAASGGTAPLAWSLSAGALPSGLALASNGTIAGTPSAGGTAAFTVRVVDANGAAATRALSIAVSGAPAFTSTPPLDAWVGSVWTYDADAVGSPAPTYSLDAAPAGMAIDAASGVVTWTPGSAGTATVTLRAANGTAPDATQGFTVTVRAAGIPTRPVAPPYLGMPTTGSGFPTLLSGTGVFSNTPGLVPAAALIPFAPNVPFWSDRAAKRRWVSVPSDGAPYGPAEQAGFAATGAWSWPAGTVFVKHFDLPLSETAATPVRRLETRLLVINASGAYGVTYRWNTAGTEATAVLAPQSETIAIATAGGGSRNQTWYYPGPADCMACHTPTAGYVLGATTRQLNGAYAYPNGVTENQITAWGRAGLLANAPSAGTLPTLAALVGHASAAPLEARARSYLDANCGNCHLPGGAPAGFDARFETPLASQNLIGAVPANDLGIPGAQIVRAGDPDRSVLWRRIHTTDPAIRMPALGRLEIDATGSQLIRDWIAATGGGSGGGGSGGGSGGGGGGGGCGAGMALGALALGALALLGRLRGRRESR